MAERATVGEMPRGFTMIEILVTLIILMVGLLGLAALQAQAKQAELESYQRAQALVLVQDMTDRINANRKAALCYNFTLSTSNGTPYAGTGAGSAPVCGPYGTITTRALADSDMSDWHNTLNGAGETLGGNSVGAMIGARGCVSLDTTVTPNQYQVSVAWQGLAKTVDPTTIDATLTCGKGLYGTELQRRIVRSSFPIACLSC